MSTLHHMDMALIDLRNRFSNELQFGADGKRAVLLTIDSARQAAKVLADCLDDVETAVVNVFDERQRALATAIGTPGPQPETIEQHAESGEHPARKPKLVKASAAGGEG
jgi:hypothetical protein